MDHTLEEVSCQGCCPTSITPAFGILRQEDYCRLEANLGSIVNSRSTCSAVIMFYLKMRRHVEERRGGRLKGERKREEEKGKGRKEEEEKGK